MSPRCQFELVSYLLLLGIVPHSLHTPHSSHPPAILLSNKVGENYCKLIQNSKAFYSNYGKLYPPDIDLQEAINATDSLVG